VTPRRDTPELRIYLPPPWRAWGMPDARCTRVSCALCIGKKHTSNNEYTGITRHPRTQWFYGLFRALPGDRAFCHRRLRIKVLFKPGRADRTSANLTPASGRQDHTTSPYATTSLVRVLSIAHRLITRPAIPLRAKRCRVHRIPPRVRDDHDTPLLWGGTRKVLDVIWGEWEQKYFSENQK
jgi:hypothetical protein